MFNFAKLFILTLVLTLAACSEQKPSNDAQSVQAKPDAKYVEGEHYRIVNNINVGDLKPPFLVEYFWLGCPHCQQFEGPLQKFKAANPQVGFLRKHAVIAEAWVNDARIFYALQETNNMAHFATLFDLYKQGMDQKKFDAFFTDNKIDKDAFLEVASSNQNVLNNLKQSFDEMTENKMSSVPSIVVNGKYLIIPTDDTNSFDSYFKLVTYLMNKKD